MTALLHNKPPLFDYKDLYGEIGGHGGNYQLSHLSPCGDRFIYLFGVLRRFQHCTGHITTGSWKGRGNQYIEFARVVYCKLPTNGKQLPAFPLKAVTGIEPRPQRWEARVLPLCHRGRAGIEPRPQRWEARVLPLCHRGPFKSNYTKMSICKIYNVIMPNSENILRTL